MEILNVRLGVNASPLQRRRAALRGATAGPALGQTRRPLQDGLHSGASTVPPWPLTFLGCEW